jgi:hypothetical protein
MRTGGSPRVAEGFDDSGPPPPCHQGRGGEGRGVERRPVRSPAVGVVVEVAGLEFRVVGLPITCGSREGRSPAAVVWLW